MSAWHSVNWAPSKHRWIVSIGGYGRAQTKITVPQEVAPGPRSRKAAEEWADGQIEGKGKVDAVAPVKPPTLAELAPLALELWRTDERIKAKTKAGRESFVRNHILPALGKYHIAELTIPIVSEWVRKMRQAGAERQSLINRLSTLGILLGNLHAKGHAPKNSVVEERDVIDELPKKKKRNPVNVQPESISTLIHDEAVEEWFRLSVGIAALAGFEAGVVYGLEVQDVLLENGWPMALRVRQAVAMLGENGHVSISTTKNEHRGSIERPRIVPVHPALGPMIARWLAAGREFWCCSKAKSTDLLIPSASGKVWRPKVAEKLRKELRRLGVAVPDGLDFHKLRGFFLTQLARAGVPKDQRQRLAGHAQDVEGEHYEDDAQLFESDREAVSRIAVETRVETNSGRDQQDSSQDRRIDSSTRRAKADERGPSSTCRGNWQFYVGELSHGTGAGILGGENSGRVVPPEKRVAAVPFAVPCVESTAQQSVDLAGCVEVRTGFEPAYNGFANRCLTTWLPHREFFVAPVVP